LTYADILATAERESERHYVLSNLHITVEVYIYEVTIRESDILQMNGFFSCESMEYTFREKWHIWSEELGDLYENGMECFVARFFVIGHL
jgi:hypothetical protein